MISTALESGDFHTALPLLENMTSDQLSELTLPDKCTPLHHACRHGRVDVAQQLITHCKYSIESKDGKGRTPLHTAAQYGQVSTLKYYLFMNEESSPSTLELKHKDESGNTPLHTACVHGQLDIVQLLTREIGCDPNKTNTEGLSCLHLAAQHGHLSLVRYLIEEVGSDVTLEDEHGRSPTYLAAGGGHLDTLKYLIRERGVNPNFATSKEWKTSTFYMSSGRSLVHTASREGHLHVVRYLVEQHGCDPSHQDNKKITPLFLASQQGHMDIVTYLITKWKCDPKCTCNIGSTCLHVASRHGRLDVVKYLVSTHHCDPLCPDKYRDTPLHRAAANGELDIVKYFASISDCNLKTKNKFDLTPLMSASLCKHQQVMSFLTRATANEVVFEKGVISPSLNIFVVGNSGSGKSTLVKSLNSEGSLLGGFLSVKGITPLTAGIVPTTINSQVFGSVNIYDLAGHEEYYASHEILLQQVLRPLVLLTVDISSPLQTIEKQILYWLSVLSNSHSCHVVVIGSHADQVKFKERSEIMKNVKTFLGSEQSITFHGFIQCDCRYSSSDNIDRLRHKLSSICETIRLVLANGESFDANRLCACLMYYLKHDIPAQPTITVSEVKRHILAHNDNSSTDLNKLEDQDLLLQTCKNLSCSGHLFLIPDDENPKNSLLVINNTIMFEKVHACLRDIKKGLPNKFGIVDENQLSEILSKSLKDVMEPEHAIKYLIFAQFCTEIAADQLISLPNGEENVTHYFFPNLVSVSRPAVLLSLGGKKYTKLYTWCLECTNARHFFTPRYLHTLFIQLIKCERNEVMSECKIWKNGILIVHNNGTRSIIEVTDQTTRVSLAIQCVERYELQLVKQRSQLVTLIKSLVLKTCPNVEVKQFLLLSQSNYPPVKTAEISMAKVACSVIESSGSVAYDDGDALEHELVTDLLFFDPFHTLKDEILRHIFAQYQSNNVVPLATVTRIHSAVETCRELQEWFEDEAGQCRRDMTYRQLYRELIKYSIFTDGNLFVSFS